MARNPTRSLTARTIKALEMRLARANRAVARAFPGEPADPQPVHTVYGGAHLFRPDSAARLGALALAALEEFAPDAAAFGRAFELTDLAATVRARVVDKLRREPVEDLRIDFEDGYGHRSDAEEDGHAQSCAEDMAAGQARGTLPPRVGIRIKPLSAELHARSLRTLDLFVTTLARRAARAFPPDFVVTIPKVMTPAHVSAVADACGALERRLQIPRRALRLEVMVETPQSILSVDGTSALRPIVGAGRGRVVGAHFGTYDYTALCGITAAWQHMRHPACDFARHAMQVALAQSGVQLSDGGTNVLPVPVHRAAAGRALSPAQQRENTETVHRAWRQHFGDVRHSLMHGYYQGWDLHPHQLPSRYAAVYSFFLESRAAATARLRAFVEKAAQATLMGEVFDDAATGQGLLNFFVRGVRSGALTPEEAAETGLTQQELEGRSFLRILDARRSP